MTRKSFTANALTGGQVRLTWATALEQGSAAFVVERATNPKAGFNPVNEPVPGAGNSYESKFYEFIDHRTPTGTMYYRLRQIDTDGQYYLSSVVAV
ncbi:MAG: hypothetical protein H7330_15490 [Hymenobacteraceae bacterium]|nr:hypothetical protein [Hymenobacteraceae bacterium]